MPHRCLLQHSSSQSSLITSWHSRTHACRHALNAPTPSWPIHAPCLAPTFLSSPETGRFPPVPPEEVSSEGSVGTEGGVYFPFPSLHGSHVALYAAYVCAAEGGTVFAQLCFVAGSRQGGSPLAQTWSSASSVEEPKGSSRLRLSMAEEHRDSSWAGGAECSHTQPDPPSALPASSV